jgi:histidinol-phosphatase (PHP family)
MADVEASDDRLAHDLPLDSHLHTDFSHDADVDIEVYAAFARARGIAEIAITDHLDFDARDPNFKQGEYDRRRRTVRETAERWDGRPEIRFGAEITYEKRLEADIRSYLAGHPYDYLIGSVHISERTPLKDAETAARWCAGKTVAEASAWYFDDVLGAIRSGLFDTLGHLDVVKRFMAPHLRLRYADDPEIYEPPLRLLVETGIALEVNSSGLRQAAAEMYPSVGAVDRFRELGGTRIVAGSDAHRADSFGFALADAYEAIVQAGFEELTFRRGAGRVAVPLRAR